MNPAELRMMWMSSQYNSERITLEDAATLLGHSTVGLSVMEDMAHQPTLDMSPMMSIVGGDFTGQAAAAAAALGVQPGTLIATNTNNLYGFAHMGGLQQQLLQQSAAATVFQNYAEVMDGDDGNNAGVALMGVSSAAVDDDQQVYGQLEDGYDDGAASGGMSDLEPKQEIINIDDFVMMNEDNNSYDGTDFMTSSDKDISQSSSSCMTSMPNHDMLVPLADGLLHHKLLGTTHAMINQAGTSLAGMPGASGSGNGFANILIAGEEATGTPTAKAMRPYGIASGSSKAGNSGSGSGSSSSMRAQRKTRKIEPVNRPGLVLKTPIAYKGNIDPSVIPIQKDGMAVCERCGAIGVKHTFYTKSRRFCSMACARGELYSLVLNSKMDASSSPAPALEMPESTGAAETNLASPSDAQDQHHQQQQQQSDIELTLQAAHIKNANYRFRITDQSKITQLNGFGEPMSLGGDAAANNVQMATEETIAALNGAAVGDAAAPPAEASGSELNAAASNSFVNAAPTPKALRLFRDAFPQEDLPQIPKYERLPAPCPQMEKIISIRRRMYDPMHSYDWLPRLGKPNFYAAPVTCFPHAPGYEVWDSLGVGMKVEVENTDCDNIEVIQPGQTPTSFWVATILEIKGYKALMSYEGFDVNSHDFWVNLCNAEVHSVGWCATRGKPLIPPRTIEHKYKDWKDFLVERLSGARTLPSNFYNKVNDSLQSRFRLGLNLECVDKDRISQVRLATVTKIVGKRLFLRYFDSDDGFWCHEDSPIIHPVGWATTVGHNLAAPQDYLERMLAGREAMIEVHEDDATIELFKMNFTFDEYFLDGKTNGFIEGMKLEAVDPLNLSSICPATVMAVLKFGYMMIRIDSYQPDASGSDWFCYHEKSPCIFPAGFCDSNNIAVTPPNGYDSRTFTWEGYLRDTGAVAAGQHLFHRIVPDHGFEAGMSLECADLMDPRLVCVATVARVVGRLLKVHFDGWTDEYDQWLDCESADIYPVGWCVLVGHKLEGPPRVSHQQVPKPAPKPKVQRKRKTKKGANGSTGAAANKQSQHDNSTQTAVKPRTIALKTTPHLPKLSIKLELKPEHHNAAFYENNQVEEDEDEDGVAEEDADGDCSTSHMSEQSTTTSSDQFASLGGAPANTVTPTASGGNSNASKTMVKKSSTTKSPAPPIMGRKATSYIANSAVTNSKYIPRLADVDSNEAHLELMPDTWNVYDVSQFLRVNDCTAHCDTFSRNKIDGKRLLQLTKDDIMPLLGMKVGPALKISDLIAQLKCKLNPSKSRSHKTNKSQFL
ncbi:PREDICTED: polycomb protein Sfmbt isoform X1 [Drosophila arizonae]|uniref:Polycomb protein Sfmbt isoform X1 n=2 Tax=Drosophila arizonae TaxID=7263 RepID=A0ABM1NRV8_DROAR|nr:PREDICTED: polycomb protein Sfmbt isoform X1 [Drosophila arizonae]XP_017857693.1 PREDICTED: polycomb protein Sfmbt isoform X1 [Drosophila arizonae]XP_017857694.1 PREDICTED: polycomb protein Sfmbt isoform X1 [Drosophila arizonae]XP_017857695.1 PREDICTED: polycomb protein Sfmbt isoform X1 [Drosophila arizonae]